MRYIVKQRALEKRKEKNILSEYFYMTLSLISEISTLPKHIQADINLEIMFPESSTQIQSKYLFSEHP